MLTVALHGFLGRAADWDLWRDMLPGRFAAWDLFSPSSNVPPNARLSMENFAEELIAWARSQRKSGEKLTLIGYSLGGRLALQASFADPELWNKVILLSTHPGLMGGSERAERSALDKIWAQRFRTEPWENVMADWNSQGVFAGDKAVPRKEADYDREALAQALENWSLATQTTPWGDRKPSPLTWVVGERDEKFKALASGLAGQGYIDDITVIPEAGHRLIYDCKAVDLVVASCRE